VRSGGWISTLLRGTNTPRPSAIFSFFFRLYAAAGGGPALSAATPVETVIASRLANASRRRRLAGADPASVLKLLRALFFFGLPYKAPLFFLFFFFGPASSRFFLNLAVSSWFYMRLLPAGSSLPSASDSSREDPSCHRSPLSPPWMPVAPIGLSVFETARPCFDSSDGFFFSKPQRITVDLRRDPVAPACWFLLSA